MPTKYIVVYLVMPNHVQ